MNPSRPSVIGASSDITRNGEPPSVTPTGYTPTRLQGTWKPAVRMSPNRPPPSPPIAHRRQREPAPSHLVPLFGDEVPDTFSLGVPHPLPIFIPRTSARLVRVVVRPNSCTAVKAHVLARWSVGSRHRPAAQGVHIIEPHGSAYLRVLLPRTPPHLWHVVSTPTTNVLLSGRQANIFGMHSC